MLVRVIVGVRGRKISNKKTFLGLSTVDKTFDIGTEKVGSDGVLSNQTIAKWAGSINNRFKNSVMVVENGIINTYRF